MSIRRSEIERFSVISFKPFEAVMDALKAGVGQLDLAEFEKASHSTATFSELESVVNRRDPGRTGLMLFIEMDHGAVLRKETGRDTPRINEQRIEGLESDFRPLSISCLEECTHGRYGNG